MILTILKYFGLCLAAISSIWGTTHELTTKTSDNRKQLTKSGIVAIFFVIIGLIVSIVSDDIARRDANEKQQAKVELEAKRTNEIIIATQPLSSLSFVLQFESSDVSFRKQMEIGQQKIQKNNSSQQGHGLKVPYEYLEKELSLIHMLEYLAQLDDSNMKHSDVIKDYSMYSNGIIALIPLDGSPNAILSFGTVGKLNPVEWDSNDTKLDTLADILPQNYNSTSPVTTKQFSVDSSPCKYTISWNLDPLTLKNSVDRANKEIGSLAQLPQVINFVILRIGNRLPFTNNNFALTSSNLWEIDSEKVKTASRSVPKITLSATVNGFSEFKYNYSLKSVYNKPLLDSYGEEIEIGCTILEFKIKKTHGAELHSATVVRLEKSLH